MQEGTYQKGRGWLLVGLTLVGMVALVRQPRWQWWLTPNIPQHINTLLAQSDTSAQTVWKLHDWYEYSYRLPPQTTIPPGPWNERWPALQAYRYAQVTALYGDNHFALDIIPQRAEDVALIANLLGIRVADGQKQSLSRSPTETLLLKVYESQEATQANGYVFEDKQIKHHPWIHISFFSWL